MKRIYGAASLLLLALAVLAAEKSREPFYRRFLVPGNPLDEKIKDQEKRVAANPKSADLRNDFGNLLALRRFPKEAREQYETAIKLDRSNFLAPYNLGLLYEMQGEISRAIRAYEMSVDRNRGFPPSRFRLARLYEKTGLTSRAIEEYSWALRIDPEMRDPRHNPLVIDSQLLHRVSLENYPKDFAKSLMVEEAAFADSARFRRVPLDRPVSSRDLVDSGPPEPIDANRVAPTPRPPSPLPPQPGETRPQGLVESPPGVGGPPVAAPQGGPPPAPTPYRPIIMPAPFPTPPAPFPTPEQPQ
jgi:tetratricopeptide (TPR) repeat protein